MERFIELSALTPEEEMVLRTRIAGHTIIQQSMELDMSVSSINRIIKRLKIKYDDVAKFDPMLPPRRFTVGDTYLLEKREEDETYSRE